MTRFKFTLIALLGLGAVTVTTPSHVQSQEFTSGALTIDHPWSRPTIGNAPNSAAYLKITNKGETPDTLIGVSSAVASKVQLHAVMKEREVMRMRHVKDGIAVPASATLELKPGGYHIMLLGLTKKLTAGENFGMTLKFERQGDVPIKVKVVKQGAMKDGAMKDGHGHGGHGQ